MTEEIKLLLEVIPSKILEQELTLIEQTCAQAEDIRLTNEIKALAKNDAAMNLNFKNEGQRNASIETVLRDNVLREKEIMIAHVHLEYQENLLRSYIMIAGMEWVLFLRW